MRQFLRNLFGAVGLAATLLAVANLSAFALTNPPTFGPRNFQTQQTGYIRINVYVSGTGAQQVNGIPCVLASGVCVVKVGALPYNALILRAYQQIITSFNSGSSDQLGLGISASATDPPATAVNLVALQSVAGSAGNPTSLTIVSSNGGISLTGNGVAQYGRNGGQDVYVEYSQTGSKASTGQAILIIEYIAPNDGTCVDPGMGVTPTGANAAC